MLHLAAMEDFVHIAWIKIYSIMYGNCLSQKRNSLKADSHYVTSLVRLLFQSGVCNRPFWYLLYVTANTVFKLGPP